MESKLPEVEEVDTLEDISNMHVTTAVDKEIADAASMQVVDRTAGSIRDMSRNKAFYCRSAKVEEVTLENIADLSGCAVTAINEALNRSCSSDEEYGQNCRS